MDEGEDEWCHDEQETAAEQANMEQVPSDEEEMGESVPSQPVAPSDGTRLRQRSGGGTVIGGTVGA